MDAQIRSDDRPFLILYNTKGQEWQLGVPEARNIRSQINGTSHEM